MFVNILGTDYEIIYQKEEENIKLKDANGICETCTKKIVIQIFPDDPRNYDNIEAFQRKVVRHEIVHAFLHESGLDSSSDWARNEEIVDWIALQAPKLAKAFDCAGVQK